MVRIKQTKGCYQQPCGCLRALSFLTIACVLPGRISRPAVQTTVVLGNDSRLLLCLQQSSRLPAELGQGAPELLLLRHCCCCPDALRAPTLLTDDAGWSILVLQLCRKGWDLIQVSQAVSTLKGGIPASALPDEQPGC